MTLLSPSFPPPLIPSFTPSAILTPAHTHTHTSLWWDARSYVSAQSQSEGTVQRVWSQFTRGHRGWHGTGLPLAMATTQTGCTGFSGKTREVRPIDSSASPSPWRDGPGRDVPGRRTLLRPTFSRHISKRASCVNVSQHRV